MSIHPPAEPTCGAFLAASQEERWRTKSKSCNEEGLTKRLDLYRSMLMIGLGFGVCIIQNPSRGIPTKSYFDSLINPMLTVLASRIDFF